MLKIGELDRRVRLQNAELTKDDYGENLKTWNTFATVWAKILYRSGDVNEESEKNTAIGKVEFFIRNLGMSSLTMQTRIFYDSKYFYLEAINEVDGRGMFYQLLTKEKR